MMKSKTKKVILVGEEHSDTSHMQQIAKLAIQHLQNNESVAVALEQNCGIRKMEDLSYVSIPPSRTRSKVIDNYIKDHPESELNKEKELLEQLKQRNLDNNLEGIYIKNFTNIDNEIRKNIDKFCQFMVFDLKDSKKHFLEYAISLHKMAIYAFNEKKSLQFISVDTEDVKPEKSPERDGAMYKNIISSNADIVIYPVGSAHIHDESDGDKRLATLLIQDPNIVLELANLYTTNNKFSYNTVQEDIESFKNVFNIEDIVVHNVETEVLDEFFPSEEIKVRDKIVLKKPIFKVFKGCIPTNDQGLSLEDIEYNLKQILNLQQDITQNEIKLSDKVISFHMIPSEITQWLLLNNNVDEKTTYLSIIEITGDDKHHACIMRAMLSDKTLYINIIDPLSEEDSIFKNQLEKLKSFLDKTLAQNGYTVQCDITYKGLQDSYYATCGDMCLIMVQELMYDQSVKYGNVINIDLNFTVQLINGTSLNELLPHNFDYDNYHHALLGQDHT